MKKNEIKTEIIGYVPLNKGVLAISRRKTKKGVKCYLHYVNEKVYNYHEISLELALGILKGIKELPY